MGGRLPRRDVYKRQVVVRLMAAAIPLFLVFYVTKMNDLTNAAVKQLHVPYKYCLLYTSRCV